MKKGLFLPLTPPRLYKERGPGGEVKLKERAVAKVTRQGQKMELYNKKDLIWHRRKNRETQTDSEELLWERLRSRKLNGLKFRRQYSVDNYVLDVYCPEKRIAIEVDGGYHRERREFDRNRDNYLQACSIRTIRVTDKEVLENIENVLLRIKEFIEIGEDQIRG